MHLRVENSDDTVAADYQKSIAPSRFSGRDPTLYIWQNIDITTTATGWPPQGILRACLPAAQSRSRIPTGHQCITSVVT